MSRVAPLLLTLAIGASPAYAEVLLVDAIAEQPTNSADGLMRPTNGQNMQAVEARFGAPQSTHGPVGEPPISRWDYPGYSVYFEHDKVLTSVVHRKPVDE
jgi:hypothetical protein